MNLNLIFQEVRQLKNRIREQNQEYVDVLYNQSILGQANGLKQMKNIIIEDFTDLDQVDAVRTDASVGTNGVTVVMEGDHIVYTNDFPLSTNAGTFNIYTVKDRDNFDIKVEVSNEDEGEFFVEAVKLGEQEVAEGIEERFEVVKNPGSRLRLRFTLTKPNSTGSNYMRQYKVIYQY